MAMVVGETLRNRYRVLSLLGQGGFSETYLAEDLDLPLHPKCVVKYLKPKSPDPEILSLARRMFNTEAKVLQRLGDNHPQIPTLYAFYEQKGEFFLVQEFVDGHDLMDELIPGRGLAESVVAQMVKDILEVLAFVHSQNIIHRDIKPRNIMRRHADGKIVLIDFGAVKEVGSLTLDAQGNTAFTVAIGTPTYMPSEQANGKPRLSSDVYAVGRIAIQALTGVVPSQLPTDRDTGEVLWRDRAPVSAGFADIVDTMVRDHFSLRFPSALEALEAMRRLEESPDLSPNLALLLTPSPTKLPPAARITPADTERARRIALTTGLLAGAIAGVLGMVGLAVGDISMIWWPPIWGLLVGGLYGGFVDLRRPLDPMTSQERAMEALLNGFLGGAVGAAVGGLGGAGVALLSQTSWLPWAAIGAALLGIPILVRAAVQAAVPEGRYWP